MKWNIFARSEQYPPRLTNQAEIDSTYKFWRVQLMFMSYCGYAIFYFTRKSLTFSQAGLIDDGIMDKAAIGLLATIFYFAYGASKFLSGMLSDSSNPRYFMAIGLMMTGVINLIFGASNSFWVFAILWGLNAFFQGWGWPPAANLLTTWYSRNERGFWWSIWNTSHNVGGLLIPIVAGYAVQHYGWRYGLYIPGVIAIIMGGFLAWRLRDRPETIGLPPVGEWRNDQSEMQFAKASVELPIKTILLKYILPNKWIWILSFAYFLTYVVRTAVNDWGNLYMKDVLGYLPVKANSVISWFELGGFFGSIAAGWGSDLLFKGRRTPMNTLFSIGILACTVGFMFIAHHYYGLIDGLDQAAKQAVQATNQESNLVYLMHSVLFAVVGFFIFGPQMLIGMVGAEAIHKNAAGTATGFLSFFAQVGGATAGFPLAWVIQNQGWNVFFSLLAFISAMLLLMLVLFAFGEKSMEAQRIKIATQQESK